jgi:hypothetical protein
VADWLLLRLERQSGLEAQCIRLIPILETAAGLERANEICQRIAQD